MEKKCQDCKHWERKGRDYADEIAVGLGECIKAKAFWQCTNWGTEETDYRRTLNPEFKDLKMFVQDMSDCSAHLWTRPDFYCYHFEAK